MKKVLKSGLTLYFNSLYPKKSSKKSNKSYRAVLGIGGNIGNVKKRFDKLYLMLSKDSRFDIESSSPILKNPPFGFLEQDDFLNAVVSINTNLPPYALLRQMQRFENRFKRKRSFKDAPRTLDIDIVFVSKRGKNLKINSEKLTIPHPCWSNRESVTIPLEYI